VAGSIANDPLDPVDRGAAAVPRFFRFAFLLAVLVGGALFWVVPRPPMGDLPQHASQVVLLHDLLTGTSTWADIVRINYFTPYLLAFSIATALSFILPVLTALKVVLTLAYFAFVAAAVALRKEFRGDERLDWLFLPGYFGFAFSVGMYTFLVATPVGLIFLLLAKRFAVAPTRGSGLRLVGVGVALFFSHGLVFVFCCGIGFVMALLALKRSTAVGTLIPYAVLGLVAVVYGITARTNDPLLSQGNGIVNWEWNKPFGWHRLPGFMADVMSSTLHDPVAFPAVVLMLAAPWILGARTSRNRAALVPFAAILVVWFFVPGEAIKTTYMYPRFAIYFLPAYAYAFGPARGVPRARSLAVQGGLALLCFAFFGSMALRERRFARESAPFETILAAAEPGQRALSLVFDPSSPSSRHAYAYHAYPMWYQAERGGFVDFNFAFLLPEIVRFRPDRAPPMTEDVDTIEAFDWHKINASIYRYFFVRHTAPLPANLFQNDQCRVELVTAADAWSLYERKECKTESVAAGTVDRRPGPSPSPR
jgi:hypothetical protein